MQVFSRPTYDRIAKYILSEDESVRVSILRAFTGIQSLSSARQLDEHYNPFDPLDSLRKLINSKPAKILFEQIRDSLTVELSLDGQKNGQASEILKGLSDLYDDLSHAFPSYRNRSTVDFRCETAFGYITIEFQVAKQDFWDKRALAYIASIFGNQLRPKPKKENDDGPDRDVYYRQIQNVIGINLLGDGTTPYWKDGRFIRDYTFVDQRGSGHRIPALRLIQYSLGDANLDHKDLQDNADLKQWIEFFKSAHEKDSIPQSVGEPVKKAYSMIQVDTLKKKHPDLLKTSDEFFASLTEHDQAVGVQAMEKNAREVAKRMISDAMVLEKVVKMTQLSLEVVEALAAEVSAETSGKS
jgi:predicted transposase/invertase (TIGR01784 family)